MDSFLFVDVLRSTLTTEFSAVCCVLCVDNTKCLAAQMKEQRGDADTVQTHVTEQGNPEREPNGGLCDLLLTEFGRCL